MKKFIAGVVVGTLLSGTIAFAATYTAYTAGYKVLVNGKEFTSDPPPLVVEGRTYLPLRAMGDALGVPVEWNAELGQAEVGITSATTTNQYSRTNPAPIGTTQIYTKTSDLFKEDNYTISVKILETIRGEENINKVRKPVITDDKPKEGYELMMVKVAVSLISTEEDIAVEPTKASFTCFTSNNEETEHAYLHMEGENGYSWLGGKLYSGGKTEGWICVQVKKDDKNPKIAYGLDYNGLNGIWFSLTN